jgi:hypothetical protein
LYNDEKVLFYYDANQVQTHEIIYSYDLSQNVWELEYKTDFTYYPNGLVKSYVDSDWDINLLQWVPGYKLEFTYDANGNLLSEEEFYMYAPSTVWEPDHIYEYTWDAANLMVSQTEKYWEVDSLAYINQYKWEYTYLSGNILSETQFGWDDNDGIWVYQNKDVYSYDMSMKLILLEIFGWNSSFNQWEANYKTTYTYNASGYLELAEGLEYYNSNWNYSFKTEYQYDLLGNKIETENSYYNSFDSLWEAQTKDYIEYNVTYVLNDLILPTTWWWFGEEAAYMITEMSGERWITSSWEDDYEDTFYYTTVNVTGIREQDNASVKVYPNPAHLALFVQWESPDSRLTFELFDLSGRKVLSQEIDKQAKLDMDFLGQGFYFYTLSNDQGLVSSGKISIL